MSVLKKFHISYFQIRDVPCSKNPNNPLRKWIKDMNIHFTKEVIQRPSKHMRSYSTSLAIMKMQIKITMRYQYTPVRRAEIKNSNNRLQ